MNPLNWLEDRLGLGELVRQRLDEPVASRSMGRALSVSFGAAMVIAMVSGIGLSFVYAPSVAGAWGSVYFAEFVLSGGWYVRSLHKVATEAAIIIGLAAMMSLALERAYRNRRELGFWGLSAVVGLVFFLGMSGNALRWDNRAFFGLLVESSIVGGAPVIGSFLRSLLLGGSSPGNWTLTRLFTLHAVVVPAVILLIAWLAGRARRRAAEEIPASVARPYAESQLTLDVVFAILTAVLVGLVSIVSRAPLEAPADPLASYSARPEWYFLALYVGRTLMPVSVQGLAFAVLPLFLAAPIAALPLLDRDDRSKARFAALVPLALVLVAAVVMTAIGLRHEQTDKELVAAKAKEAHTNRRSLQIARTGIHPSGALEMVRQDPVLRAESIFSEHCAGCHRLGDMGPAEGKETAPSLDHWGTEAWVLELLDDPDHMHKFGGSPFKEKMPSYTKPSKGVDASQFKAMEKKDMEAIARYLAAEAAGATDPNHDADGAKLIASRCTTCHLFRGQSDDATSAAPELLGWGSIPWTIAQVANPGTDTTYRAASMSNDLEGHMPRYDEKLSPDDVSLVARLVWARARAKK